MIDNLIKEIIPKSTDNTFFMRELLSQGKSTKEEDTFKQYLMQVKQECGRRLLTVLYHPDHGDMDLKFWVQFGKKPWLGRKFNNKLF